MIVYILYYLTVCIYCILFSIIKKINNNDNVELLASVILKPTWGLFFVVVFCCFVVVVGGKCVMLNVFNLSFRFGTNQGPSRPDKNLTNAYFSL